jgi:acyl-CoA thioester hydrolase
MDLGKRKVSEFEEEKVKIIDDFIKLNKSNFLNDNLIFCDKLKK